MPCEIDAYIDALAAILDLPMEPAWRPAIKANVEMTLAMARIVDEFKLPDHSEPAGVYVA